jgi:hypothetical protein
VIVFAEESSASSSSLLDVVVVDITDEVDTGDVDDLSETCGDKVGVVGLPLFKPE